MAKEARSALLRYASAVGLTALAAVIRWALNPALGYTAPFVVFLMAVAVTALYSGIGPALVTAFAGALIGLFFWLLPFHSSPSNILANLIAYLSVSIFVASLIEMMRRARRRAEEAAVALNESRKLLSTTLGSIGDAVVATDEQGRVTFMNTVAESLTGRTRGEALGHPVTEIFVIINEQLRQPVENPVARVLREGVITGLADYTMLVRKDGSEVPIDDSAAPIRDDQGKLLGAVLVFRDINERRKADEALRQSRERLDLTLEASGIGFWYCDLPFNELIWDVRSKAHFGLPLDQPATLKTFYARLHPDDRQHVRQTIDRAIAERTPYDVDYRTVGVDDRLRWVHAIGRTFYDKDGTPTRFAGITIDVTERKRAEQERVHLLAEQQRLIVAEQRARAAAEDGEQRSRFLAEASAALASSLDYETTLRNVARLAVPYLADWCVVHVAGDGGHAKQLAIMHADPEKTAWAEEVGLRYLPDPSAPAGVSNILRTGQSEYYPEVDDALLVKLARDEDHLRLLRQSNLRSAMMVPLAARSRTLGVITFIASEAHALYTPADLALAEDLARRAALAVDNALLLAEAHRARAEAEEANRMKDEFLATVSHELRTPLNAIVGWSHMLRTRSFDEATTARALETIERNAKSQAQIVDDILDVSRIITGKLRLNVQPLDLTAIVEAAMDSLRPAAEAKEIHLTAILDPDASPVSGDASRLQQVAWNLLANAVKFTPKNGHIQVRLERVGSQVELIVADTGQGIRADLLPYVFDRFRQGDSTSTRLHGGLGLGLAIVRHLVELHGGRVTAESGGEDCGATFTVKLPLMALHLERYESGRGRTGALSAPPPQEAPDLAGIKVLVVDDEPDTRDMLRTMIGQFGAQVKTAASGAEALRVFDEWPPDVIVSDIEMPGEDGYQLIRRIRQLAPERGGMTPAVALTAYARTDDRLRALSAGYQMHVAKPADPVELAVVIASLAAHRHNRLNM
jgi:PAS domain S-box-containing protein